MKARAKIGQTLHTESLRHCLPQCHNSGGMLKLQLPAGKERVGGKFKRSILHCMLWSHNGRGERVRCWPENDILRSLLLEALFPFCPLVVGAAHFTRGGAGHKEIRESAEVVGLHTVETKRPRDTGAM